MEEGRAGDVRRLRIGRGEVEEKKEQGSWKTGRRCKRIGGTERSRRKQRGTEKSKGVRRDDKCGETGE
jgi:hypothetical protein